MRTTTTVWATIAMLALTLLGFGAAPADAHRPLRSDDQVDSVVLTAGAGVWIPGKRWRWVHCVLTTSAGPTEPIAEQELVLEARSYGGARFRRVGSGVTGTYGQVSLRVSPLRTTVYRCRWAGIDDNTGPSIDPVLSPVASVGVQTHLKIHVRRTADGDGALVTGVAKPRHPGTRVTLYARGVAWDWGAESQVLDRGRLSRRGTYELSGQLPDGPGPWTIYVEAAAAPGNIAGPSAYRYIE
jgi:hypothetical protein